MFTREVAQAFSILKSKTSAMSLTSYFHFEIQQANSAIMESEERPNKMRKLDNGSSHVDDNVTDKAKADDTLHQNEDSASTKEDHLGEAKSDGEPSEQLPSPVDTAPAVAAVNGDAADSPLSKNQMKKLRRKAEWESKREERKTRR